MVDRNGKCFRTVGLQAKSGHREHKIGVVMTTRKYAICNELYEGWSMADVCEHAWQIGYTGLEIAPFTLGDKPTELSKDGRIKIRREVEQTGMQVVGLHWLLAKTNGYCLTSDDASVRRSTLGYLEQLAELCADLGGHVMVLGSPQKRNFPESMSYEEAESNATEVLQALAPKLAERQVTLALEPLGPDEGNFMLTADSAVRIIERIESEFIRLHLDVKAMSTESKSIAQIIQENEKHLVHFHANDPNRQGPGMGDVEYRPIFDALDDVGYDGWISVEVFDYQPGIDFLTKESIRYMKSFG